MSQEYDRVRNEESKEANLAADTIPDFPDLYPRQTNPNQYTVLHLKDGGNTAYRVNTKELTCSCPDETYNREDGEVCKHLAAALHGAPKKQSLKDMTFEDIMSVARLTAGGALSQSPSSNGSTPEATDDDVSEAVSEAEGDTGDPADDTPEEVVPTVERWVKQQVDNPGGVTIDVGPHDGEEGIRLDLDKSELGGKDFEWLKSQIKDLEESTYHAGWADDGCYTCNKSDGEGYYHIPTRVAGGL